MPISPKYTKNIFGRTVKYHFTPMAGGEPFDIHALVHARLYSSQPSEAEKTDTTNTLGTAAAVSTTASKEGDFEHLIELASPTDTDPTSDVEYVQYWVVVNFVAEDGGDTLTLVDPVFIWRTTSLASRIRVQVTDVIGVNRKFDDYYTLAELEAHIERARGVALKKLREFDQRIENYFNLEELNDAVTSLACAYAARGLANQENTFWFQLYTDYKKEFEDLFTISKVGYEGTDSPSNPFASRDFSSMHVPRVG